MAELNIKKFSHRNSRKNESNTLKKVWEEKDYRRSIQLKTSTQKSPRGRMQ